MPPPWLPPMPPPPVTAVDAAATAHCPTAAVEAAARRAYDAAEDGRGPFAKPPPNG